MGRDRSPRAQGGVALEATLNRGLAACGIAHPHARGVSIDADLSTGVTGDIHFVDSGYNIITMPQPSLLANGNETENGGEPSAIKDAAQ